MALVVNRGTITDPERWLFATLRNRCVSYHRLRTRRFLVALDETLEATLADRTIPAVDRALQRRDLEKAIERLPARCRDILRLRYWSDLTPAETAAQLEYSPKSMKKLTTRCLAAMYKAWMELSWERVEVTEQD